MSTPDDYPREMGMHPTLDDTAAEAILTGRPVPDPDLALVAAFVGEARSLAHEAPPAPSPALATILAGDPVRETVLSRAGRDARTATAAHPGLAERSRAFLPHPLSSLLRKVAAAGLAAKIALGAGVAAASITGAAASGVLPGPVQDAVAGAVRAVTPFEFPHSADVGGELDGGISGAPGAPASGRPAAPDDVPGPSEIPASEAPAAPHAGDAPPIPGGGSATTTVPGATPPTTTPPPDSAPLDPGTPPPAQPEPAPTAPKPTSPKPTPDTEPAPPPTTDAPADPAVPSTTGRP
jgi:hypothetical protein